MARKKSKDDGVLDAVRELLEGAGVDGRRLTKHKDVNISREGKKIIIPEDMSYGDAIQWLDRKREEDERTVAVREVVDAYPFDGAYAFMRALQRKYGWASSVPTPGFFGDNPPIMLGIDTGVNKTVQIIWGRVEIPGIAGHLQTGIDSKDGHWVFLIGGEVKQKHKQEIAEIADLTRKIVREESIYKGKAIRIAFNGVDKFEVNDAPRFLDTSLVEPKDLILSEVVERLVHTALFTPIMYTDHCRKNKIPLKRGILLEGPYGTGKTLTANVAAKLCEQHSWTFLYLSDVRQLKEAIYFAQQYQPAVVFAEDIDRVLDGERDRDMDKVLNTIDGVDTKHAEVIVVLTTNHVDKINRAMLRPGRLDAVVSISPPDAGAVERLIRTYGKNIIEEGEDLKEIAEKMSGQIPAVIREVVERAKLASIGRTGTPVIELAAADLDVAADSMLAHLELMKEEEASDMGLTEAVGILGDRMLNGKVAEQAEEKELLRKVAKELGVKVEKK